MGRLIHKAPLLFFSAPVAVAAGLVAHFALATGAGHLGAAQAPANAVESQVAVAPAPYPEAQPVIVVEAPLPSPPAAVGPETPQQPALATAEIAPEPPPAPVVANLPEPAQHVTIKPGGSLWALSRVLYGAGRHYVILFQANKGQIQDPRLIYPGQVLDAPKQMDN